MAPQARGAVAHRMRARPARIGGGGRIAAWSKARPAGGGGRRIQLVPVERHGGRAPTALEVEGAGADCRTPEVEAAPATGGGVTEDGPIEERVGTETEIAAVGGRPRDHHLIAELEREQPADRFAAALDEIEVGAFAEVVDDALEPLSPVRRRSEVAHVDLPHAIEVGDRARAVALA